MRWGWRRVGPTQIQDNQKGMSKCGIQRHKVTSLKCEEKGHDCTKQGDYGSLPSSGITSQDQEKPELPATLGPRPPAQGLTSSVPQCRPWMGVLLALTPEVGVLLAFLAIQPGQASKTEAAAFTFWPRTLGGVAQVAPTRRFSPVSHLRRRRERWTEMGKSP